MRTELIKINIWLFVVLNLLWAIVILPLMIFGFFYQDNLIQLPGIRSLLLIVILSCIQVCAFVKLRQGYIFPAIIAIIALSLIIDIQGFKIINLLIFNVNLIYTADYEFIFDFKLFHGPHSSFDMSLSELRFRKIGFNTVGLIQIFFLYQQDKTESPNKMRIK